MAMGTSYPSPAIPPEEYLARGLMTANAHMSHRVIDRPSQDESGVSLRIYLIDRWHGEPRNTALEEHDDIR